MKGNTSKEAPNIVLIVSPHFHLCKPCSIELGEEEMDRHLQQPSWKLLRWLKWTMGDISRSQFNMQVFFPTEELC